MSRYLPATAPTPTTLHSSVPISPSDAHDLLQSYLLTKHSSQPWSHSHDAGTTASLKKIELSLRGIHGPEANTHFADPVEESGEIDIDDAVSKVDTDEGGEMERRRVYETVETLEAGEDGSDEDGLKELQNVKRDDEVEIEEMEVDAQAEKEEEGKKVVDKEERKRLKKLRTKEEKKRKEAERLAADE
ncbi:hypothetical protein H072_10057 [Dactylellina haptotyla CBS 200.50]|uniref:Uncharacterized protein n=1 Tax=Dactylellina haptotyla (strain CBS 200.50) TaxID=1284197 RepID=S8A142_DACHA|nr:hypothetical protein H072_10057 [Dactylellina haptotyla CBS 200.50]